MSRNLKRSKKLTNPAWLLFIADNSWKVTQTCKFKISKYSSLLSVYGSLILGKTFLKNLMCQSWDIKIY